LKVGSLGIWTTALNGNAWFPTSIKALQSDRHRIKLTVLYETLCKDCAQFFQQVIYPKIWALGKDFIDLELIPYGNAIRSNDDGTQVITCQHGSFECTMNKLHSCLLYELKGATVAMPAIMCLFQNEHLTSNITELFNLCAEKESFSKKARDKVFNCFIGYRGITLEEWMALRTENRVVPIHTTSTSVLNISLFLSTDTDLINLIRFLWFLFSHTISTPYTGIKLDLSSRGLLGSSK
ncbi:Gamma-interferon-inducible lysosomal thiol reductase, partial [Trichinella nelsoni]